MSQHVDRRIHADALRRHSRLSQAQRFKRQATIMLSSVALGGLAAPYMMLDPQTMQATRTFIQATAQAWFASGTTADPAMTISYDGADYAVSARAVAAHPYYRQSASATLSLIARGCWLGFAGWLTGLFALRGAMTRRRERALSDRIIAGTVVTSETGLAKLTSAEADGRALMIGSVPLPPKLETRHMAIIGTTGSGKTTVLRQLLDGIEARGEAGLVYDTSGEFIAHYYQPDRGDIILNPFDARCAFWSPFAEIAHPADADRIANQLVTETGQHDRDVWLETSRILVANMIRALWREGNCTLPDLLNALQVRTKDDLKDWLGNTSSARTFAEDADRATGSVLFMLANRFGFFLPLAGIGYRSSLTEIIQIIGRATRDAPGKAVATFTNLIAEPNAEEAAVVDAINDTLKAIAASLLMEQVLAPRFNFTPKNNGPIDDFDYGPSGYQEGRTNVGFNEERGQFHFEIKGLVTPKGDEAKRICAEDLNEVITAFVQDKSALERGLFDGEHAGGETIAEELTKLKMGKIVRDRYPELSDEDQESVRQHAIAALNLTQEAKRLARSGDISGDTGDDGEPRFNTALIDGVRKFAMDVRDLDIDLIDRINPFAAAYSILAKSMNEGRLKAIKAAIEKRNVKIPYEEARELALAALTFKRGRGRVPEITASDPWEKKLAEGVAALARYRARSAERSTVEGSPAQESSAGD